MAQWRRLKKLLSDLLGDDWSKSVKLEIQIDTLCWFVMLIARGINAQKRVWKNGGALDDCSRDSLINWKKELERLVDQIEKRLNE